jgi:adenine phosphoribosyltransferase
MDLSWKAAGMAAKDRGPRPQPSPAAELRADLRRTFRWRGDRNDDGYVADPTGWWADASILRSLGPALADLFGDEEPTVVLGPQSRGALLGALVAAHLDLGMVELRKDPSPAADSDRWLTARTPPDYRDRNLRLGARKDHLGAGDRVLLVDDWVQTGGQASGARDIVGQSGATWCGVAVIVDGLSDNRMRRDLNLRSLLNVRDLRVV